MNNGDKLCEWPNKDLWNRLEEFLVAEGGVGDFKLIPEGQVHHILQTLVLALVVTTDEQELMTKVAEAVVGAMMVVEVVLVALGTGFGAGPLSS